MEPYGYSTFCEDVREEVGGKRTLVGTMPLGLLVPAFPFVLPKLAVLTSIVLPPGPQIGVFDWQITFPGDEPSNPSFSAQHDYSSEQAPPDEELRPEWSDADVVKVRRLSQTVVFSPVQFVQAGLIKVRVVLAGHTIKAGVLRVGSGLTEALHDG